MYRHAFEGRHDKSLAPFEDRCRWARALAGDLGEGVRVCTIEQELPVPSFTVDTLQVLAERHREHRFRLVVGADVLPQVPHWKDWARIERDFRPIVVGRQGFVLPAHLTSIDFPDVSSTDLRMRLQKGLPIDHLVTRSVARLLRAEAHALPWQESR